LRRNNPVIARYSNSEALPQEIDGIARNSTAKHLVRGEIRLRSPKRAAEGYCRIGREHHSVREANKRSDALPDNLGGLVIGTHWERAKNLLENTLRNKKQLILYFVLSIDQS